MFTYLLKTTNGGVFMLNLNAKERILLQDEKAMRSYVLKNIINILKDSIRSSITKFIFSTCTKGTTTSKYH